MSGRILIADDNSTFRKALRSLLEPADHWEIVEAANGEEAVCKTIELRPDVVILDLAMPGLDGLSAAREIAKAFPEIPLLMCTMHTSLYLELEARKIGIRAVISKSESSLILPAIQRLLTPAPLVPSGDSIDIDKVQPIVPASNPVTIPPPEPLTTRAEETAAPAPPVAPKDVA